LHKNNNEDNVNIKWRQTNSRRKKNLGNIIEMEIVNVLNRLYVVNPCG
jgi:hypothetical protein